VGTETRGNEAAFASCIIEREGAVRNCNCAFFYFETLRRGYRIKPNGINAKTAAPPMQGKPPIGLLLAGVNTAWMPFGLDPRLYQIAVLPLTSSALLETIEPPVILMVITRAPKPMLR